MTSKIVVLIGCGAKKAPIACAAKDMYQSDLFKKALAYAYKLKPCAIYILSAKHHLLELDDPIEPYNETLNNKKVKEIRTWSQVVLEELKAKGYDLHRDSFVFLAGKNYYKYLLKDINNYKLPYSGCKGIGYILQFLTNQLRES